VGDLQIGTFAINVIGSRSGRCGCNVENPPRERIIE
jgi:hypothetical protein